MNNSINVDMDVNNTQQGVITMNNQSANLHLAPTYSEISLAINKAKTLAGVLLDDCAMDNDDSERRVNLTTILVELLEGIESKFDKAGESSPL